MIYSNYTRHGHGTLAQGKLLVTSLLKTKLNVPLLRAKLVLRPRLLAWLDLVRTLTLESAPPGFGKTTLISARAAASDPRSTLEGAPHARSRGTSAISLAK